MVGKIAIKIEGGDELDAALKSIMEEVSGPLAEKATLDAGKIMVSKAKAIVKAGKTGNMEAAIDLKLLNPLPSSRTTLVGVSRITFPDARRETGYDKPSRRAHLLEYGTKRSDAFPFMRPAFDTSKQAMRSTMKKVFSVGMAAAVKRNKVK